MLFLCITNHKYVRIGATKDGSINNYLIIVMGVYRKMEMSTQEREFLQALLSSKSVNQAIKKVGFSSYKGYTLWNDKEFRAEFNKANDEIITIMLTQLATLSMNALEVLTDVMNNPSEKGAVKVQAAKTILDTLLKLRDQQSLSNRMDEIEERLEQLNEGAY